MALERHQDFGSPRVRHLDSATAVFCDQSDHACDQTGRKPRLERRPEQQRNLLHTNMLHPQLGNGTPFAF